MRRKRFTEEQIIGILKEGEAGGKTTELCRRQGISEQTFCRWKAKYGGWTSMRRAGCGSSSTRMAGRSGWSRTSHWITRP